MLNEYEYTYIRIHIRLFTDTLKTEYKYIYFVSNTNNIHFLNRDAFEYEFFGHCPNIHTYKVSYILD